MDTTKTILSHEQTFYSVYSKTEKRDYGALYHNADTPLSADSNHAQISNTKNLEHTILDIKNFYSTINITPHIYIFSKKRSYLDSVLQDNGFEYTEKKREYLVQKRPRQLVLEKTLEIRQIFHLDAEALALIDSTRANDAWSSEALKEAIRKPFFFVFAGYRQSKLMLIGSLNVGESSGRIDTIYTEDTEQKQDCYAQLINYISDFNKKNFNMPLYTYDNSPDSIKTLKACGFTSVKSISFRDYWSKVQG